MLMGNVGLVCANMLMGNVGLVCAHHAAFQGSCAADIVSFSWCMFSWPCLKIRQLHTR